MKNECFFVGAGTAGLEPVTFCVTGRRSNQLSYAPIKYSLVKTFVILRMTVRRLVDLTN